jgi:methylmalonyl-CoA carboxyltransferase large subunit
MTRTSSDDLAATLDRLQQAVATLTARVARLEAQLVDVYAHEDDAQSIDASAPTVLAANADGGPPVADEQADISPDVVLAIAAAVAAYLGERAHVKQIRLISSQAWGRQGRVSVQASHALNR